MGRFSASVDGRFVDASPSMAAIFGLPDSQDLMGRSLGEFCPDNVLLHRLLTLVRAVGRAGVPDLPVIRADGETISVALAVEAEFAANGTPSSIRGLAFEVGESQEQRQRLFGTQRMEALGRLAGGIAHEFNNLLTVMTGHGDRLVEGLGTDAGLGRSATAIVKSARRASTLTQQLLAFGRRQVFQPRVLELDRMIEDARPRIAGVLGEAVDLRIACDPQLPRVSVDSAQVSQVLLNLAAYANEAMTDGGTLTITVDAMTSGSKAPRERPWIRPGRYVRVKVSDTSTGLDSTAQAHLFEPFFSPQRQGVDKGLGLGSVYGIVKQSGGYIWVSGDVETGTRFTILFPALVSTGHDVPDGIDRSMVLVEETVLVVEDDDGVRALLADELRRRGYRVIEAASGDRAFEAFSKSRMPVDLLLVNVALPDGSGPTLVQRLRALDPAVRVLYTSGVPELTAADTTDETRAPYIQKPYSLQTLIDTVRAALDAPAASE